MQPNNDVWTQQATQWERVGAPLRPGATDRAALQRVLDEFMAPRALVLGVTPEMARLAWPAGTDLVAADLSQEMIDRVWPGFPGPGQGAIHANWLDLPLGASSRDVVVSDGCFGVIAYPGPHRTLLRSMARILSAQGRFAFRVFLRPDEPESPAQVFSSALAGDILGFHAFKLRLLMAVQPSSTAGVVVGDVWRIWSEQGPSPKRLHECCGWPMEQIATIDAYRDNPTVYCFQTRAELLESLEMEGFRVLDFSCGDYELAERCPTFVTSYSPS